jgi:hypothetical protein
MLVETRLVGGTRDIRAGEHHSHKGMENWREDVTVKNGTYLH